MPETIGRTQEELEDREIQQLRDRGAGEVEIQTAVEALAAVRAARAKADAEAMRDSLKTAQERYDEELEMYDLMRADQLISDEEHEKARAALAKRLGLDKADDVEKRISVAGTFSGYRLAGQFGGAEITAKEQLAETKRMRAATERWLDVGERIVDKLEARH